MPARRDPATVERTRVLVTTTLLPLDDIARQEKLSFRTVRDWMKMYGWRRPPGAGRVLKITPENEPAVRRLYESGAAVPDLAILLDCDASYVNQYARSHEWRRLDVVEAELNGEIAAIVAALREPAIDRGDAIRQMERAIALSAADALAGGDARLGRRVDMLGKLVGFAKSLPEDAAARRRDADADSADHFPDANDLIEEIARRFEDFSDERLDPRVLAAVAATVP
jgi:hypothetical protein